MESLQHVKSQYSIDNERIALRGFSMGGAGHGICSTLCRSMDCCRPGGFVDTAKYRIFSKEPKPPVSKNYGSSMMPPSPVIS